MKCYPRTQPVEAWQYVEGEVPPDWVQKVTFWKNTFWNDGELFHRRMSGDQLLNHGEWLVKDLDGAVVYYTDEEFKVSYITEESLAGLF